MANHHSESHAQADDAHGEPVWLADPTDTKSNCGVGAVVDLDGGASHDVVADGIELLCNLEHRGTTGAEEGTGDGAGIMIQRPDAFFEAVVGDLPDTYAVGSVFMPQDETNRPSPTTILRRSTGGMSQRTTATSARLHSTPNLMYGRSL